MSNIAGIVWNDTANAPGVSVSVYFSGCDFHCPECHNQQEQDFNYGVPFTRDTISHILERLEENGVKRSVSILGGEPLHPKNLLAVYQLAKQVKEHGVPIYLWTGYTMNELRQRITEEPLIGDVLIYIDCIIDGRFIADQRDITLKMRGSKNQKIYFRTGTGIFDFSEKM